MVGIDAHRAAAAAAGGGLVRNGELVAGRN
jgi:hypothetical protein